jgi:5-formyltetrahydrofolate cyclo-ligase
MLNKADIRRNLIAKRAAITPALRSEWDHAIATELLAWWRRHPVPTLGIYWPMRGEPNLLDAFAKLAQQDVQLALPVVDKDAPLVFARWAPGEPVVKDKYGVSVPNHAKLISPAALLIPCVGFNQARFRLGYGGGFYDRTLAQEARPQAIGIAYSCTLAEFKTGIHDVALDAIITEQGMR